MQNVTGHQFADNALWKFFELIVRKSIALVISTILARLLLPEAYGVVALTTVFITFSDIFLLNGFNVALIRKDEVSAIDYSTVMVLGIIFSLVLYSIIFISAPVVARFYGTPQLVAVLRVITILLFFQAVATVIRAKATRELHFKEMSLITLAGNTSASLIGVFMAFQGYGVWALVAQQVLANVFDLLLLSIIFKWKYSFEFSKKAAKKLFGFTAGVIGASFLDFLGNNANSIVIGKAFTPTELGLYNRGNMYPETIGLNAYSAINSVLLPILASRQDNMIEMHRIVRKVISLTEFIIFPMMFGFIAVSDNFIQVLLTDRWLPCVNILICSSIYYCINPVRSVGYSIFYALGESKKTVKIELFRSTAMLVNLFITIIILHKTIYVLAATNVVLALLVAVLTQWLVNRRIGYSFLELVSDLVPTFFLSFVMLIVVRIWNLMPVSKAVILIFQLVTGVGVYWLLSITTKNPNYKLLVRYAKTKFMEQR